MSVVMRYTAEQVAEWKSRAPEPLELDLPGWTRSERNGTEDRLLPNERLVSFEQGERVVRFTRYWDYPLTPGHPMVTASKRAVQIGDRQLDVHTTSMFEGFPQEVQVLFVKGKGFTARFVFQGCPPALVDELCAGIEFRP